MLYEVITNADLHIGGGRLSLAEPLMTRGFRQPIDHFFRSLAEDQGENAIGVILSGTGSDGTLGVKAIKAQGGLVVVQDEESARYPGMPHSAIETGMAPLPTDRVTRAGLVILAGLGLIASYNFV